MSSRGQRSRALFAAAITLLFTAGVLAASSCRSVIGADDFEDSAAVLCDKLEHCYAGRSLGACGDHVSSGLEGSEAELRADWLRQFSDRACLESCSSARRCLDIRPVCLSDSCVVKEDCCGFVGGRSDCNTQTGTCCRPRGNSCVDDADCCPGAGTCNAVTGTCGGVVCTSAGNPCLNDFECCTGSCEDFACAETICGEDGFECADASDCCSGYCDPASGHCAQPACGDEANPCGPNDPCCAGLVCVPTLPGAPGVCSKETCFSDGLDCATDAQCCTGHCDPLFFQCGLACKDAGDTCVAAEECCSGDCTDGVCIPGCSNSTCEIDADCCTNRCKFGVCAPACGGLICHSMCEVGAPMDTATCTGVMDTTCLDSVCAIDPYCCCDSWDSLCVTEALSCVPVPPC